MRQFRNTWLIGVILILSGLAGRTVLAEPQVAAEKAPWTLVHEHWYVLELDGQTAGWSHELVETDGSKFRSAADQKLSIARGSITLQIEMSSTFVETAAGEPVRMTARQNLSRQVVEQEWIFETGGVKQIVRQGGQETTKALPPPEGLWLTPMAVERYLKERRSAGAEEITYRAITSESGISPVDVKMVFGGKSEVTVGQQTLPVTIWKSTTSLMAIESVDQITEDGYPVRSEIQTPGLGTMVTRLATKAEAMATENAPAPELMVRSFVHADKPMNDAERSTRAKLRVKVKEGPMPPLPSAGAQTVQMSDDGSSATLTIDIGASAAEPIDDDKRREYLGASAMVDADDAMVKKLAAKAVTDAGSGEAARAAALRGYVHDYVSLKGMDTAFASASETARTRTGDCSEHAVLLCAMLRANGIPARVAIGLLYVQQMGDVQNVFGWHMWTQALIDGRWVDYDATLTRRYHAGHVLASVTSLADGAGGADLASILSLIGNLEIQVLEVGVE